MLQISINLLGRRVVSSCPCSWALKGACSPREDDCDPDLLPLTASPPALCSLPSVTSSGPCHPRETETSQRCLCTSLCWMDLRVVRRPRPCSLLCSWPCTWWPSWGTSPWSWSTPWIPVCTPQCTSSSRTSPSWTCAICLSSTPRPWQTSHLPPRSSHLRDVSFSFSFSL